MNIAQICADYAAATEEFLAAATGVEPDQLDRHLEGEWSPRQVIHHMADSEAQSYARLRRLLAEPVGTLILGYDEAAWGACAVLGYTSLPVENSLDVIRAVRRSSLDILARLVPEDLDRQGAHSESGPYSVANWINTYCSHPREHALQIHLSS